MIVNIHKKIVKGGKIVKDLHIHKKYSDGTDENLKSSQTLTFLGKDSGFGEKNNSSYIEIENKLILIWKLWNH